jgi:predicted DNA-binding helix-hairpin-helix protein
LTPAAEPNLDMRVDPKTSWAVRHPELFPIDVNSAPKEMLLRIPGIGQRSADRLVRARRLHRLTLRDLQTLRVRLSLARPFIVTADWQPASRHRDQPKVAQFVQPLLWSA